MLTTIDILKALLDLLRVNFPTITIQNSDLSVIEKRPCFYINLISSKSDKSSDLFTENTDSVDLIYFAPCLYDGFIDLLKMKESLKTLFKKPIKINNTYVLPDDITFNVNRDDSVLNCIFDIKLISKEIDIIDVENDNDNLMEHLYIENTEEI